MVDEEMHDPERTQAPERGDWPTLDDDAGRELAQSIREMFGRDNIVV